LYIANTLRRSLSRFGLKSVYPVDEFNLFLQISAVGAAGPKKKISEKSVYRETLLSEYILGHCLLTVANLVLSEYSGARLVLSEYSGARLVLSEYSGARLVLSEYTGVGLLTFKNFCQRTAWCSCSPTVAKF
jgi:hypothetical protein